MKKKKKKRKKKKKKVFLMYYYWPVGKISGPHFYEHVERVCFLAQK